MSEYDDQQQPPKIKIDMDDLRRELPDLAREFAVLVMQEIRFATAAQESAPSKSDPAPDDHLSPENINRIMGNAGMESSLADIAKNTEAILEGVKAIPAAIQQMGGA